MENFVQVSPPRPASFIVQTAGYANMLIAFIEDPLLEDMDLSDHQVKMAGNRVIDWQRPILGPKELDLAILLDS